MQFLAHIFRIERKKTVSTNRIGYLIWLFIFAMTFGLMVSPSQAQRYGEDYDEDEGMDMEPVKYSESALRRFEIVFTSSIPFTALHGYMTVRGVEMIRQNKVAPSFSRSDWNSVGGLTILFSGLVGFWDYMHTRKADIQDLSTENREFESLSMWTPVSGIGYTRQVTVKEPMLRLLSAKF